MNSHFSTRSMLIILSIMFFLLGIHLTVNQNIQPADIVLIGVMDIMMIYLCVRDARQNGQEILKIYRAIMFFSWPWSILFYYIWFRGWKGLKLALLWGLLFVFFYVAGGIGVSLLL